MINFKNIARMALLASTGVLVATASYAAPTLEKGVLQVGTDLTYPPYNYFNEKKEPAGMDVELMTLISKQAGLNAKFLDTRFENLIIGVKSNKFDVIASTLYVKPERAQQVTFIPYMKTGVSIAVRKDAAFRPSSPEQLCGKKVASIKGAAWIANLEKLSKTSCGTKGSIDVREFPTSPEATQAVMSGGVDAQMEDSAVLSASARQTSGRIEISSRENLYPVIVGLAVQPGNKELVALINNALDKLRESGAYQKLLNKYAVSAPTAAEFKAAITP